MSVKRMNSIRKYLSQVVSDEIEDQMDVDDNNFTERYLNQFECIDSQTIEVLINNGYESKESLLAFDLKEDLPLLPDVNMAQKSLLRKVLQNFRSDQELESKVNDIKGVDEELAVNSNQLKRKRALNTSLESPTSLSKRSRASQMMSDIESDYQNNSGDGLGSRMKQMVSGRKSIRGSTLRHLETEVKPDLFQFSNNRRSGSRSGLSRPDLHDNNVSNAYDSEQSYEEEEEVEEVVPKKVFKGRIKVERDIDSKPDSYTSPIFGSQTNRRNSLISDTLEKRRSMRGNNRLSTTTSTVSKAVTSGGTRLPVGRPAASHVPTPTELEVREHLAKQKALGTNKRSRKRV